MTDPRSAAQVPREYVNEPRASMSEQRAKLDGAGRTASPVNFDKPRQSPADVQDSRYREAASHAQDSRYRDQVPAASDPRHREAVPNMQDARYRDQVSATSDSRYREPAPSMQDPRYREPVPNASDPRYRDTSTKHKIKSSRKGSARDDDERGPPQDRTIYEAEPDRSRKPRDTRGLEKSMRNDDGRDQRSRGFNFSSGLKTIRNTLVGSYPEEREDEYYRNNKHYHGHEVQEPRQNQENALLHEIDQLRQENALLKDNLRQEQDKVGKFIRSADRMQKTMDNKELFLGGQALDDEVQGKFQSLLSQIRTWSSKLEQGPGLTTKDLDENTANEFEVIAPGCLAPGSPFWQSGKKSRMLIRGWVGYVTAKTIFRTRSGSGTDHNDVLDQWMGDKVQNAVAIIEDRLAYAASAEHTKLSIRNLHDWRALTVELLSRINLGPAASDEMDKFIESKAKEIMLVIERFVLEKDQDEVYRGLMQILHTAIMLSQFLRRQRAYWWIVVPSNNQATVGPAQSPIRVRTPFDSQWMKDDDADDEENEEPGPRLVQLFVAPGLFKQGNIEGEGYEDRTCVVPMLVTCS